MPGTTGAAASAPGAFAGVCKSGATGTGPGIDGGSENKGRDSSRNENAGTADESANPKLAGTVGEEGCDDWANSGGETSASENGNDAVGVSAGTNSVIGFA